MRRERRSQMNQAGNAFARTLLALSASCLAAPAGTDLRDYPYDPDALPRPVLEGREDWIELYCKAWDLAADKH